MVPAATSLSFDLEVHNGRTKTSVRIKEGGTLKVKNKSLAKTLRIESEDSPPPFMVPGYADAQSGLPFGDQEDPTVPIDEIIVQPGQSETVQIHKHFTDAEFMYEARIEGAAAEDPIVIIERR